MVIGVARSCVSLTSDAARGSRNLPRSEVQDARFSRNQDDFGVEMSPSRVRPAVHTGSWVLFLAAWPILAAFWTLREAAPWPTVRGSFQASAGIAGLSWLGAILGAFALDRGRSGAAGGRGLLAALYVILVAVGLRVLVLGACPALSDDVNRYVFEGGLVGEGKSPYAHAPAAPERLGERERWSEVYARVNHPEVSAAYPPLAQYVFALTVAVSGGAGKTLGPTGAEGRPELAAVRAFRVLFACVDLLVLLLLLGWLRARGRHSGLAVVWAWCPLVAMEYAGSAHFDVLGILFLVAALFCFEERERGRWLETGAFVWLGLGAAIKFLPALAVPLLVRHARSPWRGAVAFAASFAAPWLGLLTLEEGMGGLGSGLGQYALRWESFSVYFRWIETPVEWLFTRDGGWADSRRVARGVIALLFLVRAYVLWRSRRPQLEATVSMVGLFLVLTPTLHPWYLTWLLPFLALKPRVAWFLFFAAAPLLYWPLTGWRASAEWNEPVWLWYAIVPAFTAVWLVEARLRQERERLL